MSNVTYVVHVGTGTIISADECVTVTLTDEMANEITEHGGDDYFDEARILELAEEIGTPLFTSDLTFGNTISFSPSALREEARYILASGMFSSDETWFFAMEWCINEATDDQLNAVASWMLDNDDIWTGYRATIMDGLVQGMIQHNKHKGETS